MDSPEHSPAPADRTFAKGERVQANYGGYGKWFAGVVDRVRVSKDGKAFYHVRFDDGDYEGDTPASRVRGAPVTALRLPATRIEERSDSGSESESSSDDANKIVKKSHNKGGGFASAACKTCGSLDNPESTLLCDACDEPYHLECVGLFKVPRSSWFCPRCEKKRAFLGKVRI
ncbi:hypothetical protein T492DRAFT_518530 [Pavlovales sp. CCMP2436]|nr:hypothetical protein T492DRAFT_518530 [Pavlovales sp. CCMP2436]